MKSLVSSVTSGDFGVPKVSAERSLHFASSIFKPFSHGKDWSSVPRKASALRHACKQGKSTEEFPERLFASWSFIVPPNSSNWKGQLAFVPCRPWPPWWVGPTTQLACLSRVECSSPRGEIMCRPGTCLLLQCPRQCLPVNLYFLDLSHIVSSCC